MFFHETSSTEIYTLSLHDALPIWTTDALEGLPRAGLGIGVLMKLFRLTLRLLIGGLFIGHGTQKLFGDRKSTRLNSSHANISYAVFCLKKKTNSRIYVISDIFNRL